MTEESKASDSQTLRIESHPLWRNPWQVVRFHGPALTALCSHRYEWTARTCAAWRDLCTDAANIGKPVRTWHDYRRTPTTYPHIGYKQGSRTE